MIGKRWYRFGVATPRRAVYTLLLAGVTAAMLAFGSTVWAQDGQAEAKAEAAAEAAARAAARAEVFSELAAQVRQLRVKEAAIAARRVRAARQKLEEQLQRLHQAIARRNAAKARTHALEQQWEENEARIAKLHDLLAQHKGNLGALFGVIRKVAADAAGVLKESLLTTQFEPEPGQAERSEFLLRLAQAQSLPSIKELQRLWFELLREIVGTGKVVRYQTNVLQLDKGKATGTAVPTEVVRIGPFTVVNGGEYLGYLSSVKSLTELKGVLPGRFQETAYQLTHAAPGSGYTSAVVDPASGALLGLYLARPSWLERIQLGEAVGYVIIAVGIIGVFLALIQYVFLLRTRRAVSVQRRNPSQPAPDNPLGRLLLTFHGDEKQPANAEVAEVRVSEALRNEVPALERFQSFLRLAVAAGPLLGLIGTVTGMIITFHAIVASGGGSDPTLMAQGIGQAMIATVLGLGIAIPLLFINAGLTALSGNIIGTLDEFSQSLLAEQFRGRKGSTA